MFATLCDFYYFLFRESSVCDRMYECACARLHVVHHLKANILTKEK